MIRKISLSALAMSMFVTLASAEVDFDNGGFNIKEELSNIEVPLPAVPQNKGIIGDCVDWLFGVKRAEWTIMVFINGKNNLEQFALKDMNEMEVVGSTAKMNIVAETGRIDGYDTSDDDWKGTRRFLIKKDEDTSKVTSPVVQEMGKVDMGDYKSLAAFGKWAKEKYPARKYMLIVWNHGSGWEKNLKTGGSKGISYDDETGNHINTIQLGQALKEIGGVDVYASDACLMQMAEVAYELKNYATYIVGSEETEAGDGYAYNTFFGPLADKPAMTPAELAKLAVDAYSDYYQVRKEGSTQSFIKAAAIPRLRTLVNRFASALMKSGEKDLAKKARDAAVKFAVPENKDLYDFVRQVVAGAKSADVKAKGQALMTFITSELVMHNRTNNDPGGWSGPVDYSPSGGIAAYFPSGSLGAGYPDLQWAKYSNWDEFVTWMNQP